MVCLSLRWKLPQIPTQRRRPQVIATCTSCFSCADLSCVSDSCSGKRPTCAPPVRFFLSARKFAASPSTSFAGRVSVHPFPRTLDRPPGSLPFILIWRSEEHTSELQSQSNLVCRLLLEKKSLPKEWAQQMENLPIGPCAGSCGTAAYRRSQVIVSDIATNPLWDVPEHRAAALKHGLQASWSNPVLSSKGKVLGTFCMYYRERRTPTSQDLELIELATHLVRVAIERDRAEEALRASEQVARGQVEALTYSLDVLATAPAPDKFLGQMLSTIGRLLDAQNGILWLLNQS